MHRFSYLLLMIMLANNAYGQVFDSGSTGADGPLFLTAPGTTIFDPIKLHPSTGRSDVYHFSSIYIGSGVTVKLSSKNLTSPVFWLSAGPVEIDGTIDLNGDAGGLFPSLAGAGGYPGAAPRQQATSPTGFVRNRFLVPLVGGSGGDGGEMVGGGAGGGALLIASSTSIVINGAVTADGGASLGGNGGNGGAIRLVAPLIGGSQGRLSAKGGQPGGEDGGIRFEAFDNQYSGSLNETPAALGKPFGIFLPPRPPAMRIRIGGISIEGAQYTVNNSSLSATDVVIEADQIPVGTVVQMDIFDEQGVIQNFELAPLRGTLEHSFALTSMSFPRGKSHVQFKVVWPQTIQTRRAR